MGKKSSEKIPGEVKYEEQWKRRTNDESKSLYNKPLLSQIKRCRRIKWFSQLTRMKEKRLIRQTLTKGVTRRMGKGIPRIIWIQSVNQDLVLSGILYWEN